MSAESSAPAAPGEPEAVAAAIATRASQLDDGAAISVRGLRMSYGAFEAVAGIDFDIQRSEIVAFLGPNGAGKTTTVEILEGYRKRSSGEVRVLGHDPQSAPLLWRDRIGVVLQESEIEPDLTAKECLQLYAGYHLRPRPVMETLDLVGLTAKAGTRGSELSGGQRRRLDVALALIGDPELVFLDEPTTGFDPSARRQFWDVIEGLRALGKTIFLTTHYMDEAERLADRTIVIASGRIVAEGTPKTLGSRDSRPAIITFRLQAGSEISSLPEPLASLAVSLVEGQISIPSQEPLREVALLAAWAEAGGHKVRDLEVKRPSLEDIYIELTTKPKSKKETS